MDLKQMKLFIAIVETGSYTRAGEREGYTQSRVTQIMKSLETELGFPLFLKDHFGAELTKSGRALLPRIQQILQDYNKLNEEISGISGMHEGSLSIGTHISCAIEWLPDILRTFNTRYPGIHLSVYEGGQKQILQNLREHRVDIGLISRPDEAENPDIQFLPLIEDRMKLVVPQGDPLVQIDCVSTDALNGRTFVLCENDFDSDVRNILERTVSDYSIRFTLRNDYSVIAMVRKNLGISILPSLILKSANMSGITSISLDSNWKRTLGIGLLKNSRPGPAEKIIIKELQGYVLEKADKKD